MVNDAEAGPVRGARHGVTANEAAPSLNILSDLSASGPSPLEPDRMRRLGGWLAGMGVLVAGVVAGVAWVGQGNDDSTRSNLARPPAPWEGRDAAGLQREPVPVLPERGEHPMPDARAVVTSEGKARPDRSEPARGPVSAEGPAPTSLVQVGEARPAKVRVRREVRPDSRRRAATAVPVSSRGRQGGTGGVAKRRATEQRPLPRYAGGGAKPVPRQDAAGASKLRPLPDVPRSERDVDIITAIVK